MAHISICVLVKNDSNLSLEDLAHEKAWPLLDKYLLEEVEPYKKYLEEEDISYMKKRYATEDLNVLAPKVEDWNGGMDAAVDEGGLYATYTDNPNAHYDAWNLVDEVPPAEFGRVFFGETGEYKVCHAIITPDGEWIQEGPFTYGAISEEANRQMDAWIERMKEVLEKHKDCIALLADCHF
ncbi:MAG: hypothetical protein ABIT47_02405 [Candidatus Paceibacterota bacterium]